MLPKQHRADRKLLEYIFSSEGRRAHKSRRVVGKYLTLTIIELGRTGLKTAFIVSSKVAPRAVDRNKIRRRARAIVYKIRKELKDGQVLTFVFSKAVLTALYTELEGDILDLLRALKTKNQN